MIICHEITHSNIVDALPIYACLAWCASRRDALAYSVSYAHIAEHARLTLKCEALPLAVFAQSAVCRVIDGRIVVWALFEERALAGFDAAQFCADLVGRALRASVDGPDDKKKENKGFERHSYNLLWTVSESWH